MKVFIHTNSKQELGALVAQACYHRLGIKNVELLKLEDDHILNRRHNKKYLRDKTWEKYDRNDLQSFTLLRLKAESLSGKEQGYLLTDPDVFPILDPFKSLKKEFDLQASSLFVCPNKTQSPNLDDGFKSYATSVFYRSPREKKALWDYENLIEKLFRGEISYRSLIQFEFLSSSKIGELDDRFNSFDKIEDETILLHNTGRVTQPWKTGLPIDFVNHKISKWNRFKKRLFLKRDRYLSHPSKKQEILFFDNLRYALENNFITKDYIEYSIRKRFIRPDALKFLL